MREVASIWRNKHVEAVVVFHRCTYGCFIWLILHKFIMYTCLYIHNSLVYILIINVSIYSFIMFICDSTVGFRLDTGCSYLWANKNYHNSFASIIPFLIEECWFFSCLGPTIMSSLLKTLIDGANLQSCIITAFDTFPK